MTHPLPETAEGMRALLAPFLGAQLRLPKTHAVDLIDERPGWRHERLNADIRSLGPDGVGVFFYSSVEIVPWDYITTVVVRAVEERGGKTLASVKYSRAA